MSPKSLGIAQSIPSEHGGSGGDIRSTVVNSVVSHSTDDHDALRVLISGSHTGAGSIQAGDQNVTAGGDSGQSALAGLNGISPVAGQDLNDLDVGVDLLQTGNDASVHSTVSLIVLAQNEATLLLLVYMAARTPATKPA